VDPATPHLDETCLIVAERARVVLPRVLRPECEAKSTVGGWKDGVYEGSGRVDVRIRELRIVADEVRIVQCDGPVGNLRVEAEGNVKLSTPTFERLDPPAEMIILRPDGYIIP
jgi:lipopolysaccharide assembly outer membrane protein LptD (OstA)